MNKAAASLERRLADTGLRLRRSNDCMGVQARPGILTAAQSQGIEAGRLATEGMRRNSARVLMRVRAGEVDSEWERCAKNDEFVQLRRLVRAGVVERAADGRYVLTLDAEYSLLTD